MGKKRQNRDHGFYLGQELNGGDIHKFRKYKRRF